MLDARLPDGLIATAPRSTTVRQRARRRSRQWPSASRRSLRELESTRPAVQLQRLQRRQPGLRRLVPALRSAFQSRRWTTTARWSACRRDSSRTSPTARTPISWRSARTARSSAAKRRSSTRPAATTGFAKSISSIARCPTTSAQRLGRRSLQRRRRSSSSTARGRQLNPRLADKLAGRGPDHLRAGHAALQPVPVVPDARAERRHRAEPRAIKLLITNIQTDAEIAGSSAVDIIDRALFYLNDKGTPHAAVAVPDHALHRERSGRDETAAAVCAARPDRGARRSAAGPHRQLRGRRQRPPRRARRSWSRSSARSSSGASAQRLAVLLHDAGSLNKVTQTLLEMVRGGIGDVCRSTSTVFYEGAPLDRGFLGVAAVRGPRACRAGTTLRRRAARRRFRLRDAVRVVRDVSRRGHRGAGVAPRHRPSRRGVGQPPSVGARHRRSRSASATRRRRSSARSAPSAATC